MWMVSSDHGVSSVTVLFDVKKSKVLNYAYRDGEDFYAVEKNTHFFHTEQEANAWLEKHRLWLLEMMPKVRDFLQEMSNLCATEDFMFERSDFLPPYYQNNEDHYQRRYYFKDKMVDILSNVCRTQMLCINGTTFPLNQVYSVNWCRGKAEINLSDGSFAGRTVVTTNSEEELEVVKILFGENTSGMQFKR